MLLASLVGLAMVVAAGAGVAMLIDPETFLAWSGSDCGDTGQCSTSDLRILGGILAFIVGPAGVVLFLRAAPWRR